NKFISSAALRTPTAKTTKSKSEIKRDNTVEFKDILMIIAVLLSPVIAVQVTRYLDNKKEARERQLWVFKTLMATRALSLSPHHVEALNRID
ncbi:DUF6680 family protein, partial [Acinetobacter baumannii]